MNFMEPVSSHPQIPSFVRLESVQDSDHSTHSLLTRKAGQRAEKVE